MPKRLDHTRSSLGTLTTVKIPTLFLQLLVDIDAFVLSRED